MLERYESDFGAIDCSGLGACLQNHLKTKRWRYVTSPDLSSPCEKEYLCVKGCSACAVERHLNDFLEAVFKVGGMTREIRIDPPALGTKPQDPRVKLKLGPIPEVPY